jgi:hypothetical protein
VLAVQTALPAAIAALVNGAFRKVAHAAFVPPKTKRKNYPIQRPPPQKNRIAMQVNAKP